MKINVRYSSLRFMPLLMLGMFMFACNVHKDQIVGVDDDATISSTNNSSLMKMSKSNTHTFANANDTSLNGGNNESGLLTIIDESETVPRNEEEANVLPFDIDCFGLTPEQTGPAYTIIQRYLKGKRDCQTMWHRYKEDCNLINPWEEIPLEEYERILDSLFSKRAGIMDLSYTDAGMFELTIRYLQQKKYPDKNRNQIIALLAIDEDLMDYFNQLLEYRTALRHFIAPLDAEIDRVKDTCRRIRNYLECLKHHTAYQECEKQNLDRFIRDFEAILSTPQQRAKMELWKQGGKPC